MKKLFENVNKSNMAIIAVLALIVLIIAAEVYGVTHIQLKTQDATVSTAYEKITCDAIIVRDEQAVSNNASGVTVSCLSNGGKARVGGNVAMVFSDSAQASDYAKLTESKEQLEYYENLQAQTVGVSADLETVKKDIEQKIISYADSVADFDCAETADDLNSVLVRRQLVIGESVDLQSHISSINDSINQYGSVKPNSYITTDVSGVFYNFTDGYENLVDYKKAEETTVDEFKNNLQILKDNTSKQEGSNLGKLITGYDWYIQALVDSGSVQDMKNGSNVEVALSDNQSVKLKATIVTGAELEPGQEETLLVLRCNVMNDVVAKLRTAKIEIRRNTYEGIKVPADALHVVDGKKGVYVLIASQVKFREAEVIYSTDDYVMLKYEPDNEDAVHLYDKIITQGKDLENGKVYT